MFLLLTSAVHAEIDNGKVALIVASDSVVEKIRLIDVRRLFLGLKSGDSSSVKNPVMNVQSKVLYDEFMKNVMHMTEGSYKRKMVKRIFRQGRREIQEINSLKELNNHLLKNSGDISFAEISSIKNMEKIRIIQVLW